MRIVTNLERAAGMSPVVQSYGIESLAELSAEIEDVREFQLHKGRAKLSHYKQMQQYPPVDEAVVGTGLFDNAVLKEFYGGRAAEIGKSLREHGYSRLLDDGLYILTWKFRNIAPDDFDIGLADRENAEVYHSLEAQLWSPLPGDPGINQFLAAIEDEECPVTVMPVYEREYWFRQGINIFAIRFKTQPSPELITLVDHFLLVFQKEKMQNYFHNISSYNSDATMWMKEHDRNRRFFEIVGQLLTYAWWPFDMQSCEASIDAAGDEGLIASGSLKVDFTENGLSTAKFDRMERTFPPVKSPTLEFSINEVALRVAGSTGKSSLLSLHLVSRSPGNVDPRSNMLTHHFIKLLIETVGKLIDVIMPVIHREEAVCNLKWRSFLDSLRLQLVNNGENLHHIITESLVYLEKFFGVWDVGIYTEDREVGHMLELFSRSDVEIRRYIHLDHPVTPAEILRRQLVVFPIRTVPGGRILMYFKLPRKGNRPLHPEIPDQYLIGTELWQGVHEEALILGISELKDYLFFIVTECLAGNRKAVLENVARRLSIRGDVASIDDLLRLTRRTMERFSRFFDLFQNLSWGLESALAYIRGRRDNLSGLYNRQHFASLLTAQFVSPDSWLGLMFIDMDNFKFFNDAVNHDFGDKLLISLANRMIEATEKFGENAYSGRFGGDEFCFAMSGVDKETFEFHSQKVFVGITGSPMMVSFYFDDQSEGKGLEINLIAFLHRLMRPDVGSHRTAHSEYVEKKGIGPRNYIIDIWKHYTNGDFQSLGVNDDTIINRITNEISKKIVYNKIFPEVDHEFSRIIRLFVTLQLKDYTTKRIRESLIAEVGLRSIERFIYLKVSAGLAHSSELRLRSVESLFKAADNRAYLAKFNGRNRMFGIDGQLQT